MSLPRVLAGRRRWLFAKLLVNGLCQAAAAFATAWLIRQGLDRTGSTDVDGARTAYLFGGLALAGLMLLGLRVLERVDAERLGASYVARVRERLFVQQVRQPVRGSKRSGIGVTMTRLVTDLNAVKNWISAGAARMVVAAVSLTGTLAALAVLSLHLSLIAGTAVVLCLAIALVLRRPLDDRVRETRRRRGAMARNLGEKVLAAPTIAQHGGLAGETRRLRRQNRGLVVAMTRRMGLATLIRSLPDAALPMAAAGMLAASGDALATGRITPGTLTGALVLMGLMLASVRDLAMAIDLRVAYEVARERLTAALRRPVVRQRARAEALTGEGPAAITFDGTSLHNVLRRFNGDIAAGEAVLLVGPSGSGKSALLELAARLVEPSDGRVCIDGRPTDGLDLASLRAGVRLVSPALPLWRGTVAENIGYGAAKGTDRVPLSRLLELCGLDGALPNGPATAVAEGGRGLSSGLTARIALARALASRPRVLLLDDPAFSDDDQAFAVIQRLIRERGYTIVMTAVTDARADAFDRVWNLADGRMVANEQGRSARTDGAKIVPLRPTKRSGRMSA